jgi:formylglycine-generating enzyme required for sulfatase activity
VVNYSNGADWNAQNGNVTTVGSAGAGSASHYGTFDQGGNVWEFNDTIVTSIDRGLRGGSWLGNGLINLQASARNEQQPDTETPTFGFRVSSLQPIPEPSAYAAILGCLGLGLALTRRKGHSTL